MNSLPKYLQVRNELYDRIQNGYLRKGDKLPSEQELCEEFSVSALTIRRALTELSNEGFVARIKSKGSFISDPGGSGIIALILAAEDYGDSSYMKIIQGAQKIAAEHEYSLIVEWGNKNLEYERLIIQKTIDRKVEGILIYPYDPVRSRENYRLIEDVGIPYTVIDRYDMDSKCHTVSSDNYRGGVLAANELLSLGHTRIVFAAYHFFLSSEQERFDGYSAAMRQAGVMVSHEHLLSDRSLDYSELSRRILSREVTAVFCCNDRLAFKLMRGLLDLGVRVPEDVSIIGFDDWGAPSGLPIGLTTVRQDFTGIGTLAAKLLILTIKGMFCNGGIRALMGVELVRRESAAANAHAL